MHAANCKLFVRHHDVTINDIHGNKPQKAVGIMGKKGSGKGQSKPVQEEVSQETGECKGTLLFVLYFDHQIIRDVDLSRGSQPNWSVCDRFSTAV